MTRTATGVVTAGIPLLVWLFPSCSNRSRRGLWPRLPVIVQGGELYSRVSRQKLARALKAKQGQAGTT